MRRRLSVIPRLRPITQQELEALIGLRNQIHSLSVLFKKQAFELMERFQSGCQIEPGIHTAELRDVADGPIRSTRMVIR